MDGLTTGALREMDRESLFAELDGDSRELVQAEICRRELAGLPEGVADTLMQLPGYARLTLGNALIVDVLFTVTTDYDDGPAWSTNATVFLSDGRHVKVDFARTGVADSLVELSEHGRPHSGDVLIVDLGARTAEVRRG